MWRFQGVLLGGERPVGGGVVVMISPKLRPDSVVLERENHGRMIPSWAACIDRHILATW